MQSRGSVDTGGSRNFLQEGVCSAAFVGHGRTPITSLAAHMGTMAAYNTWSNDRLYASATDLPNDAYRQEAGAFFGSLHGTLNHLLVVDRLWLRRLTGEGEAPNRLDVILFEGLRDLRRARVAEDARLEAYVAGLSPGELAAILGGFATVFEASRGTTTQGS